MTKPLFAVASTLGVVLTARLLDRVGKGVRGAPRDAMVADIAPPHLRGAAFGLRQSLDTLGAFLGPLLAVGLMLLWADDFQAVFWVAAITGLMAVALLFFGLPGRIVYLLCGRSLLRDCTPRFGLVGVSASRCRLSRYPGCSCKTVPPGGLRSR